jgi:hypothetical protein
MKCYCCEKETKKVTEILGFNLCDECLKEYEEARKEIDKIRR